jgi:flagellar hook assembly protein FlgD
VQVDPYAEGEAAIHNVGHATSTSAEPVDAWTDTIVRGQVQVKFAIYNQAGEVVMTFPTKDLSTSVNDLQVSSDGILSSFGASLTMSWGGGRLLGTWDGTGKSGQVVANGAYYVKVDNVDAFGTVTSVTKSITVSRAISNVTLTVYNEAGEAARHLTSTWSGPIADVTEARLTASVISPTNGMSEGVTTTSVMSGNTVLAVWDGRNDSGNIVNNGQYYIEVKVDDGKGDHSKLNLAVAVLSKRSDGSTIVVRPNLLTPDHPVGTIEGGVLGGTVHVKVYTITGSLVKTLNGLSGTGVVQVDSASMASGFYILVGEVRDASGDLKQNFRAKVLVVR